MDMRRLFLLLILALPVFASDFSYVYNRGGNGPTSISMGPLDDIVRLKKRYDGTYLWAKLERREYLIRDQAVLAEVQRAFGPLEALEPHQRALDRKMKPVEQRYERLEEEIDDLTDRDDGEELTEAEKDRLRKLREEIRIVKRELRPYEEEERRLDDREEELEEVFDAEIERIVKRAVRTGKAERLK